MAQTLRTQRWCLFSRRCRSSDPMAVNPLLGRASWISAVLHLGTVRGPLRLAVLLFGLGHLGRNVAAMCKRGAGRMWQHTAQARDTCEWLMRARPVGGTPVHPRETYTASAVEMHLLPLVCLAASVRAAAIRLDGVRAREGFVWQSTFF